MLCIFEVLPGMRERKSGCIINIASRAASVDTAPGLGYNDAKAAVTRATSCLQLELEGDGLGEYIHTYALHPGGVPTAMGACKQLIFSAIFFLLTCHSCTRPKDGRGEPLAQGNPK
jgi:NAD(P)-dependent dehydrogenase (short-subunit alcohol dehydrogenase family)